MEERPEWGGTSPSPDAELSNDLTRGRDSALVARPEEALEPLPGDLTATSYRPPEDLPLARWLSIMETLQQMERSIQFWLGDCWNYGELKYGEYAAQGLREQIEQATGRTMQTIYDYGWVCRAVGSSLREETLTFDHHRSVAKLAAKHPDRAAALLRQAADDPRIWSAAELKREA